MWKKIEEKIEEKISDWRIWQCQRKILKKHARLFDLRLKPFESNEEIRDRILERINARF